MNVNHRARSKKLRKTAGGTCLLLSPDTSHELAVTPEEIGGSPEQASAFDPSFLLTKLSAGRSKREYLTDEPIFSQGDPANAVFYIQKGKVKLTVVSKSGKEAVIAILSPRRRKRRSVN